MTNMANVTTTLTYPAAPLQPGSVSYAPWQFMAEVDAINYSTSEQVAYLKRTDEQLINVSSGTNRLAPPEALVRAACGITAATPMFYHDYDGPTGSLLARIAIAERFKLDSSAELDVDEENVLVTPGATAALALVARTLASTLSKENGQDDLQALVPAPTFPAAAASLCDAGFVIREVLTEPSWSSLPSVEEVILAANDEKISVVYLNTFNNPTGEAYSYTEVARLLLWAKERCVVVIHDTVSADLTDLAVTDVPGIAQTLGYIDGLVTVGSLSKSAAIPGARLGWIVGPTGLLSHCEAMNKLVSPSSVSVNTPFALLDALAASRSAKDSGGYSSSTAMIDEVQKRCGRYWPLAPDLNSVVQHAAAIMDSGFGEEIVKWRSEVRSTLKRNYELLRREFASHFVGDSGWHGDMNVFVNMPSLDGYEPLDAALRLFREFGILTLPAPAFGGRVEQWLGRGYWLRLSFGIPTAQWRIGLERIVSAAAKM